MFTPNPPLTIVPDSSPPLIIAVIAELLVFITANPSSEFEKNARASARLDGANADFNPSVNRGTSCSNRPSGNVIWHSCSACHMGFLYCALLLFHLRDISFVGLFDPFSGLLPYGLL